MAAFAAIFGNSKMPVMAEEDITAPSDHVGQITHFTLMTANTIFAGSDTEGFASIVTGTAGFAPRHIGHGKMAAVPDVVESCVTDPAVIAVRGQMGSMAENDRCGMLQGKRYFLCFHSQGGSCPKEQHQQGKASL